VGSLGLILLGFGGSEYTRSYALSYIKALVHIGFKLFLVTVIIYVGTYSFTKTTGGMIGSEADSLIQTCMTLIGQSFLFVAIIRIIPQIADTLMSGVSMNTASGVHASRTGIMGAAGLTAGAVSAAYNAPGGSANIAAGVAGGSRSAVRSAANAYSVNFNAYKSQGLNDVRAGVSALGSTIWGGYQASRGHSAASSAGSAGGPETQNNRADRPAEGAAGGAVSQAIGSQSVSIAAGKNESAQSAASASDTPAPKESKAPETQKFPDGSQPLKTSAAKNDSSSSHSAPLKAPSNRKAAYHAPTPEELSKKFKTWD
jgi:type IV secretion system protein TrbL